MTLQSHLKSVFALLIGIFVAAFLAQPGHADGLGGLAGLRALGMLYVLAGAVILGGVLINAGHLMRKSGQAERTGEAKQSKVLITASVLYLLTVAPIFFWILARLQLHWAMYTIAALYLGVLAATLLELGANRALVRIAGTAALLYIILATPEIFSYTAYKVVDNMPLAHTVQLAPQRGGGYIHLADGRIFRMTTTYSSGVKDLSVLMIEQTDQTQETGVYLLHGLGHSQPYAELQRNRRPFITIPFKRITIEKHVPVLVGAVELLDDDWRADNRTLTSAIFNDCCNSIWIDELIRHGADPTAIMSGSRNVLHYISGQYPKSKEFERTAELFIKAGVDLNARDQWGNTPLYVAIDNYNGKIRDDPRLSELYRSYLALLFKYGADPNIAPDHGLTPLHYILITRNYDVARFLLAHGANPLLENASGESAFDIAISHYSRLDGDATKMDKRERELEALVVEMQTINDRQP